MSVASRWWPVVVVLFCAALVGCGALEPERPAVGLEKIETAALRTDREPIETRYPQRVTAHAARLPTLDEGYADCWADLRRNFDPNRREPR